MVLVFAFVGIADAASPPRTVVVLGDSLSAGYGLRIQEGWVHLLEQRLAAQGYEYRVVNASVSGETTDGGVARIDRALATHKPRIVILELGGNDGLRGLPVARVESNLGLLIARSRAAGAQVLMLTVSMPTNYGLKYASEFQKVYDDLRVRYKVGTAALMSPKMAVDLTNFQADGIHPNAQAQPQLLNNVWTPLVPLLRH